LPLKYPKMMPVYCISNTKHKAAIDFQ